LRKEKKRKGIIDKKEGGFIGEKLPTLACHTSAYVYCYLQVRAFPRGIADDEWVMLRDMASAYLYSEI